MRAVEAEGAVVVEAAAGAEVVVGCVAVEWILAVVVAPAGSTH